MATQYQPPHLLLHKLIVAMSYWGSTVRTMLFAIVFGFAQFLSLSGGISGLQTYATQFIFVVGIFLLFDAGYTTIARTLPLCGEAVDRLLFLLLLVTFMFVMSAPYFIEFPGVMHDNAMMIFLLPLFAITLRLVLGLLYGHRGQK